MKLCQHPPRPRARCSGMTMIEMMFAVVIGTIIVGVTLSVLVNFAQTTAALGNYGDLNRQSRGALDIMTREIRQSQQVISFVTYTNAQTIIFTNSNTGTIFSYVYTNSSGLNGILTRNSGGQSTLLLSNIVSLNFDFSQRDPSTNFTFYTAGTNLANVKLIDVSWDCLRHVGGMRAVNSESVQTAKIVIRN